MLFRHPSTRRQTDGLARVVAAAAAAAVFAVILSSGGASTQARSARSFQTQPALRQQSAREDAVAALVAEGVAAFEREDLAAARAAFARAIAADPNEVTAHTYLGLIADRAGELTEAERHFAAAAIAAPLSPAARNNHGGILLRLGRTEQAAAQFEASLRLDRRQLSALVNLAQIRFLSGTPDSLRAARELFERALAIAPDAEILRALTIIALRTGDRDAALKFYRDYAARLAAAPPTNLSASSQRAALGGALFEAGLVEEALTELSAAVAADPSNVDAVVRLARVYQSRKEIPAAGRTLEAAVARGLDAAPVYAALAEIYQESGHVENAIPAMRLAIERDPRNEAYRFRYGMLLTDTRAPAAAIIRLQEALKEFPNSSRLWFALGVAHSALDKIDEAAKAFERARTLDPKFAPALAYLGMTYDQQGRYAEAVALYEQSLALDNRLAAAHYLAAEALLKQSAADTARAEAHLAQAVRLDPSFAPAHFSLAKLYLRTERVAEAVRELQSSVTLDPNMTEAHYQLGRALMRLNRTTEARVALDTFKRLSEEKREQARNEPREIMRRLANVRF